MRRRGTIAGLTVFATMAAASLPWTIAPVAQATPAPSAYAVIGSITTPSPPDQVAVDTDDDTLYVGSYQGSRLMVVEPGTTSGVATTSLILPAQPAGIAVDSDDDTVYARRNGPPSSLWVTRAAQSLEDTVALGFGFGLRSLAVNSPDDTVYVTTSVGIDDSLVALSGRNLDDSWLGTSVGAGVYYLAVDDSDERVWASGLDSNTLKVADGALLQFTAVPGTYTAAREVAVSSITHQAFVATTVGSGPGLQKVDVAGTLGTWTDPAAVGTLRALSVNAAGTRAVFRTGTGTLWVLDATTMQPAGPTLAIPGASTTAQAASGLIYVGPSSGNAISVVAKVQANLSSAVARAGDSLTVTVTPTPATAAGRPVVVDDSTLPSVSFGGVAVSAIPAGANTFTVTVPSGPTGQVEAVATLGGGATLSLGTIDLGGGTPPAPIPASAPRDVVASAGDASALVSWSAPASSGSYPVTDYQVTSSPGGRACLTSGLSCTVGGLAKGTAYTFTVRALTGAGWSGPSEPSNAVVPRPSPVPSIVITGSRAGRLAVVSGTTTGFGMGAMLTPWIRLSAAGEFERGKVDVLVSTEGTFAWERRMRPGRPLAVYFTGGAVRSNTVVLPAR